MIQKTAKVRGLALTWQSITTSTSPRLADGEAHRICGESTPKKADAFVDTISNYYYDYYYVTITSIITTTAIITIIVDFIIITIIIPIIVNIIVYYPCII